MKSRVQWQPRCPMRTDGRTDGHDEANSRLSQFFVYAPNSVFVNRRAAARYRRPVINYTGPREVLLEFVILFS